MSKFIKVKLNKELFSTYVGLTISGYDLADKNDVEIAGLYRRISKMDYSQDVIDYFANARTNQNKVNPYWPRGYLLSSACFFISENQPSRYEDFSEHTKFVRSLTNINPAALNKELSVWLEQLPQFIDSMINNKTFADLWKEYQSVIDERANKYGEVLEIADKILNDFLATSNTSRPDIIFSPNLLQSPFIADFVSKGNQIIIIKTSPNVLSIIHEFLHSVFKPFREYFGKYVQTHDFKQIADITKLISSGYMWNISEEAKINVLEESFVRGLSIVMNFESSKIIKINDYLRMDVNSGFTMVPLITKTARNSMPNSSNLRDFITAVMDSGLRRNGKG